MPSWIVKAVVQKAISFLPFANKINYLFQRYVTKGIVLTEELFLQKLTHAGEHLQHWQEFRADAQADKAMELGTGWHPIVPVSLFLRGFQHVITIDQSALLRHENVREVLGFFVKFGKSARLTHLLPGIKEERLEELYKVYEESERLSLKEIFTRLHIEAITGDASQSGLPDGSITYLVSNNVLEHIPESVMFAIFREFRRIAQPKALQSHFIDLSDHFAHFDKSISPFNFLRFSESRWSWINNPVQYLNRLRMDTYRKLHRDTGFRIIREEDRLAPELEVKRVPLDQSYRHLSMDDLRITHTWLISEPGE